MVAPGRDHRRLDLARRANAAHTSVRYVDCNSGNSVRSSARCGDWHRFKDDKTISRILPTEGDSEVLNC